ncbi:hypothetical protein SCUCBS95973_005050 [Sporothrix curviconia]|uniref:ABC transporter domain-containing protein n=1 Tax=Sporothrix curviconia TaxID=1260050 RepID=A0ABP0BTK0_9PEZI
MESLSASGPPGGAEDGSQNADARQAASWQERQWRQWRLQQCQDTRALNLDTAVAPQGANFSVGQRQMLSLARATVRQSQVVILDEATASIDYRSDVAIQKVLLSAFKGRTVLAIVHRLSTIIDYDRVIVMDRGHIREMGPPAQLYRQAGSIFHTMVEQSIEHGKGNEWSADKVQQLRGNDDVRW